MTTLIRFVFVIVVTTIACLPADAQPGRGRGARFGRSGQDDRHAADHEVFRFLLTNHKDITRHVTELENGVETLTESAKPEVAAKIKEHVRWMEHRIRETKPIRMRDPLFRELFQHTDKISIERMETDQGVRVIETSDDPYVVRLIQAHAKVVSGFVSRGFAEAMKNHPVPGMIRKPAPSFSNPGIANYGKVMQLPNAAQQPRAGSKVVVDITTGNDPDELNPSIEKVARFVNIYRGAGKEPAHVEIAVVLHGEATLSVLNADAYSQRFDTKGNPNLDCLHELHEAGVDIYVCGQSLLGKRGKTDEVVVFVDVAVSALTALVNLQADGYGLLRL